MESILTKTLPKSHTSFERDWEGFRKLVSDGKVVLFQGKENELKVTDEDLEMYLWFLGQSVAAQETIPTWAAEALQGKVAGLEQIHTNYYEGFKKPLKHEPAPTLESAILRLYVCNRFFPKSTRYQLAKKPLQFGGLSTKGLVTYFSSYCTDYDGFPERPFDLRSKIKPTRIPVLYWIGDRDWFDYRDSTQNMLRFGPNVETHVMPNWGHDFGIDPKQGIATVTKMIREFMQKAP
jgi:pimeloyl-ACP methyl ester carboxylesterase